MAMRAIRVKDIEPHMEIRGVAAKCKVCDAIFISRRGAKYCCHDCYQWEYHQTYRLRKNLG